MMYVLQDAPERASPGAPGWAKAADA